MKLIYLFFFIRLFKAYIQAVIFNKIAPMTIRFAAAGVEVFILYFMPCILYLTFHNFNILWRNY